MAKTSKADLDLKLYDASASGDAEQIEKLLKRGANPNCKIVRGTMSIQQAAEKEKAETSAAARVALSTAPIYTPLIAAVKNGHFECVRELLRCNADIDGRSENLGKMGHFNESALLIATRNNSLPLVHELMNGGADVNAQDSQGLTPLWCAVCTGNIELVEFLLESGADIALEPSAPRGLLAQALCSRSYPGVGYAKSEAVAGLLISKGVRVDTWALVEACLANLADLLKRMLETGADANGKINDGMTPLMYAARDGYVETVRILLAAGARADLQNAKGCTALDIARQNHNGEVMKLLRAERLLGPPLT